MRLDKFRECNDPDCDLIKFKRSQKEYSHQIVVWPKEYESDKKSWHVYTVNRKTNKNNNRHWRTCAMHFLQLADDNERLGLEEVQESRLSDIYYDSQERL